MAKYLAYNDYQESGVDWLGKVPAHWVVKPLKYWITRNDGGVWGDDPESDDDPIVLRSTEQGVGGEWKIDDPARRKLSPTDFQKGLLIEGDLLVTKSSGSELHIGKTSLVTRDVAALKPCYSNFMQRLRMAEHVSPRLIHYVLNNRIAREQLAYLSNSTTGLANLNGSTIGQLCLAEPDREEQSCIADFLDHETVKIDRLIARQKRLIKLLKEKRQAVISHAVTKGLNPNAPMKDSGVEWLGEVPAHWGICKLGFVGRCQNGLSIGGEYFGSGYPFVSYGDAYKNEVLPKNVKGLVQSSQSDRQTCSVKLGDVLFTRTSETLDEIGFASTCLHTIPDATFAGFLIRFRPIKNLLFPGFSRYFFRSEIHRAYFIGKMNIVTRASLSQDLLKKLPVLIPPIDEQKKIAVFLDKKSEIFADLTGRAEVAINLLREHRTALISAAVTGKIDVRGWQKTSTELQEAATAASA